ncbi:MAG: YeeE/YedE family protein [Thermotogota bacterium]
MAWTGLLMGLIFGVLLQRGRVCFNSAFRDIKLMKDNYLFKIAVFSVALSTILFHLSAQFGWIRMNPAAFNWVSTILGAFIFGMGMVLAGGCASGVTYRIGEGMTTAWMAAISYGLTAFATKKGALNWVISGLKPLDVTVQNESAMYADTTGVNIASILGVNPWIPAIIFTALLLWYVFGTKTTQRKSTMNWKTLAILLAIVSTVAYILSYAAGRNYGFGITGPWVALWDSFLTGAPLNWGSFSIIGIVVGATIAAIVKKEFKLRMPKKPSTYAMVLLGGAMMGFGASIDYGCNIGHFFVGLPMLGISSLVASLFFILGNWAMTWFLYERD